MKEKLIKIITSRKLIITVGTIALFLLICTIAGPYVILAIVRQPNPGTHEYSESFYTSYEEVRSNLKNRVESLANAGIDVEYTTYAIDEEDDLYIDNIYLPATKDSTNLIVLTTGVHGMEGYIGSAMLDVFFEDIYPTIDTDKTGILIVANVNP